MSMHPTTRNLLVLFASTYNAHVSALADDPQDRVTPIDLSNATEQDLKILDMALAQVVATGVNAADASPAPPVSWEDCMLSTPPDDVSHRVTEQFDDLLVDIYNTEWPK